MLCKRVVAGRLDLFIGPPLVVMPFVQSKLIKILAVTGSGEAVVGA